MHLNILTALLVAGAKLAIPQSIDPSSVDPATKSKSSFSSLFLTIQNLLLTLDVGKWCTDQKASCPLLCLQIPGASAVPSSNTCDDTSLSYSCVCSNGQSPNISQYSQTIPYYECTQAATNCVNNCAQGDTSCQSACRNDHPCGAQNPVRVNSSTLSAAASTSASGAVATGSSEASTTTGSGGSDATAAFGGSGSSSTGTSDAAGRAQAMALGVGRTYGLALVLAAVGGGFVFIL